MSIRGFSLDGFVRKYVNKPVDFDGAYGAECVDLFRQYCSDLGFRRTEPVGGASELFTGYYGKTELESQFKRYPMSEAGSGDYPRAGDCIIWDKLPTYGHVAICLHADSVILAVFEQYGYVEDDKAASLDERSRFLGPAELKLNQAHVWVYSGYDGVLGWLRPRGVWVS
jgi:hypothetical protein